MSELKFRPKAVVGRQRSEGPDRAHSESLETSLRAHAELILLHRRNCSCCWASYNAAIQTKRTVVPTSSYLAWEFLPYAAQGKAIEMWRRRQANRADRHLH